MRRARRDLGVELRGREAFVSDRRIVAEMDQVVRDAGMLRLPLPDRCEDFGALELLCVSLVAWGRRSVQRDGITDLRLVVVRILRREFLHRAEVGSDALRVS